MSTKRRPCAMGDEEVVVRNRIVARIARGCS